MGCTLKRRRGPPSPRLVSGVGLVVGSACTGSTVPSGKRFATVWPMKYRLRAARCFVLRLPGSLTQGAIRSRSWRYRCPAAVIATFQLVG
jgi:hypothetical protein